MNAKMKPDYEKAAKAIHQKMIECHEREYSKEQQEDFDRMRKIMDNIFRAWEEQMNMAKNKKKQII